MAVQPIFNGNTRYEGRLRLNADGTYSQLVHTPDKPNTLSAVLSANGQACTGAFFVERVEIYCTTATVVQLYDGTSTSGTVLGTKKAGVANQTLVFEVNTLVSIGCFVGITGGAGQEVVVYYRTVQ